LGDPPVPPVPVVTFVTPVTDENARLVNQRGLFTKAPNGVALEKWVETHFKDERRECILIKIVIPEKTNDRADCLRLLNRMNINYLTLFPDLYGSSKYCEMSMEIPNY
jgi:hypothetical protein